MAAPCVLHVVGEVGARPATAAVLAVIVARTVGRLTGDVDGWVGLARRRDWTVETCRNQRVINADTFRVLNAVQGLVEQVIVDRPIDGSAWLPAQGVEVVAGSQRTRD